MIKLPSPAQMTPIKVPSASAVIAGMQQEQAQKFKLASQIAGQVSVAVKERNDEQQNAAFAKANNAMHDYDAQHAGKEYYSGDEIPDNIGIKKTEVVLDEMGNEVERVRERIPAYEVDARMRDQYQRAAISSAASDIDSPSRRKQFIRHMTERADQQNVKMIERSARAQTQSIRDQQNADFRQALLDNDYETAAYLANHYNGSDTERQEKSRQVRYFAESDTYNSVMSEENISGIDKSIKKLENENYNGELNEVQRKSTLDQLRSKRGQIGKKQQANTKGQLDIFGIEIDRTIDAMEKGESIPPSQMSRLSGQIQAGVNSGLISSDNATWNKRLFRFQEASNYSNELVSFKTMPLQEQEQELRKMQGEAGSGSDFHKVDIFEKNHQYARKMLDQDPLTYGSQIGLLDLEPFNFADPAASLSKRAKDNAALRAQFGDSAGRSLFTQQEMTVFNDAIQNSSAEEQMRWLSIAEGQLNHEDATAFRSQMTSTGSGELAVASDAMADNQLEVARNILMGNKAIKADPNIVNRWKEDAVPLVDNYLGGAYSSSPSTRKSIKDAIKSDYAQRSVIASDFSGEINPDRLRKSMESVTGGVVIMGGSSVTLPDRNMDADDFSSWLRDVQPNYYKEFGGVKGYKGKEGAKLLYNQIDSGELTLHNVGKDKYLIAQDGMIMPRADDPSKAFVLQYDPDATMRSRW